MIYLKKKVNQTFDYFSGHFVGCFIIFGRILGFIFRKNSDKFSFFVFFDFHKIVAIFPPNLIYTGLFVSYL